MVSHYMREVVGGLVLLLLNGCATNTNPLQYLQGPTVLQPKGSVVACFEEGSKEPTYIIDPSQSTLRVYWNNGAELVFRHGVGYSRLFGTHNLKAPLGFTPDKPYNCKEITKKQ